MLSTSPICIRAALAGALIHLLVSAVHAADSIQVLLRSGRTFTGEVDVESNDHQLKLRITSDRSMLVRSIQWDSIRSAVVSGQDVTEASVKKTLLQLRSERPANFNFRPAATGDDPLAPDRLVVINEPQSFVTHWSANGFELRQSVPSSIATLAIDAEVASWDADPEVDGIVLDIRPLDAEGRILPVSGTLAVELVAREGRGYHRSGQFPQIARWSKAVAPADFQHGVATVQLPYQAVHPEWNPQLGPIGLVHAKLSVPGQGVFEASASGVRIRPYAAVRDELEQVEGRRFFAIERTGRGG